MNSIQIIKKTQLFSAAVFELSIISAISLLSVPRWSIVVSNNAPDIFELSGSSPRPYAIAYHASEVKVCLMRQKVRTHRTLYPLGLQESVKPRGFYDTTSVIVVLVALQGLVQAFEDECPEASSRAKITYILCRVG